MLQIGLVILARYENSSFKKNTGSNLWFWILHLLPSSFDKIVEWSLQIYPIEG